MTKEYFDPSDIEVVKEKVEEVEDTTLSFDVTGPLDRFDKEVGLMQLGQSKIRGGSIMFPKGLAPFKNAQKVLLLNPNKENLDNFLAMVTQDLGKRTSDWVKELFEEAKNERRTEEQT